VSGSKKHKQVMAVELTRENIASLHYPKLNRKGEFRCNCDCEGVYTQIEFAEHLVRVTLAWSELQRARANPFEVAERRVKEVLDTLPQVKDDRIVWDDDDFETGTFGTVIEGDAPKFVVPEDNRGRLW
jgi:hypothetical protein